MFLRLVKMSGEFYHRSDEIFTTLVYIPNRRASQAARHQGSPLVAGMTMTVFGGFLENLLFMKKNNKKSAFQ